MPDPNPTQSVDRLIADWASGKTPDLTYYIADDTPDEAFVDLLRIDILQRQQRELPWSIATYRAALGEHRISPATPAGPVLIAMSLSLQAMSPQQLLDDLDTDWQDLSAWQDLIDQIRDRAQTISDDAEDDEEDDYTVDETEVLGQGPSSGDPFFGAGQRIGDVIGGYKLRQLLGRGGFGEVYAARHNKTGRVAAIKLIRPDTVTSRTLKRFEVESEAMRRLGHPNVARIYRGGKTPSGEPYLAMEFIEGVPIQEYCDNRALSINDRLELFVQVCAGVQHIHDNGLIHRDLSPDNILVTEQKNDDGKTYPVPKVIDLGVVSAISDDGILTTTISQSIDFGKLVGKFTYMSPEQVEGGRIRPDVRTDIFSLGVILYELLTGAQPIGQKTLKNRALHEIVQSIARTERPTPSAAFSALDPKIAAAVREARGLPTDKDLQRHLTGRLRHLPMTALRLDRNKRFTSVSAMSRDIENYLHDRNYEQAAQEPRRDRMLRHARRHAMGYFAVGSIILVLTAGIIVSVISTRIAIDSANEARQNATIANQQRQRAEAESAKAKAAEEQLAASFQIIDQAFDIERLSTQRQSTAGNNAEPAQMFGSLAEQVDESQLKDESIRYLQEIVRVRSSLLGASDPRTINATFRLGALLWNAERLDEAQQLIQQVLVHYEDAQPGTPAFSEKLFIQYQLAMLLWDQGRLAQAQALFTEELAGCRSHYDPGDPQILQSLGNLGYFYYSQGRLTESVEHYQQLLAFYERHDNYRGQRRDRSLDHLALNAQFYLGHCYWRMGQLDLAYAMFQQEIDGCEELYSGENEQFRTAQTQASLRNLYRFQDLTGASIRTERQIQLLQWTHDENDPQALELSLRLARSLTTQMRYPEAETQFEQHVQRCRSRFGDTGAFTLESGHHYTLMLNEAGQYARAEAMLRDEIAARSDAQALADGLPRALNALAGLLVTQSRYDEAAEHIDRSLGLTYAADQQGQNAMWIDARFLSARTSAGTQQFEQAIDASRDCIAQASFAPMLQYRKRNMLTFFQFQSSVYRQWHAVQPEAGHDLTALAVDQSIIDQGLASSDSGPQIALFEKHVGEEEKDAIVHTENPRDRSPGGLPITPDVPGAPGPDTPDSNESDASDSGLTDP